MGPSNRQWVWLLGVGMIALLFGACAHSSSELPPGNSATTSTALPAAASPTALAKVTIVPKTPLSDSSATAISPPTSTLTVSPAVSQNQETKETSPATPTGTPTARVSSRSRTATPTPRLARTPTATPRPSATRAGSNTATPTATRKPSSTPTATATPQPTSTATPTLSPTKPGTTSTPKPSATATLSPTPEDEEDDPAPSTYPPTSTPTAIPSEIPEGWSFYNVTQVLDAEARIMYLWGEVLNHTGEDQHLSTVAARVYDQTGILIADAYNTISIIPVTALVEGRKIPFELTIVLPDREFQIEQLSYELYVEARPAWYETREDLTILDHSWTTPEGIDGVYEIRGTVRNQGPPLDSHLKVIATLYDAEGYVVGLDWFHKVESSYLAPGAFQFTIQVEDLPAEATSYELQALGR